MSVCKGDKDEGEEKEKGRKMYVSVYSLCASKRLGMRKGIERKRKII